MNTAFWVTYPLRNCLKMRQKLDYVHCYIESFPANLVIYRCKKRNGLLRIFVYGQFAELFFRLFSKWWSGIQRGRKFANFYVTLSFGISVGESCNSEDKMYQHMSPLCNSKIYHDEGFFTRFALHQICLIFILILKET